ncbi:MAG TPA: ABC transporter ATP-binding protein, partial [Holosporales bacterium]|nr:ABC transporter ATP-binding protein [Holosporales bacterium]
MFLNKPMMGQMKDTETNKTTTRLKRYANVTSAVSGSVARAATDKVLGRDVDHSLQAKAITKALGRLKGPVMKIAQMLSTIPDAVPAEYALEFQSLQADAPAMGWPFVRRRMAVELGSDWQSKFTSFDHEATSAASLGQ